MSLNKKQKAFVNQLLSFAREGREDRGALADLRSGLGKIPGRMSRVHQYIVPFLPKETYDDGWYYLLATLFGSFPKHHARRSLGAAFKQLKQKSDSMETRFIALLNADSEDLGNHLRYVISLIESHKQPLDWFQLFEDMLEWNNMGGIVQKRWARDFYGSDYLAVIARSDKTTSDTINLEKEEKNYE